MNWTKGLCANVSRGLNAADNKDLSNLSALDIGTGNGLLLQELAKQGYFPIPTI